VVRIYRKGNFSTSHERAALRKISTLLDKEIKDEDIFLIANADIAPPELTYTFNVRGEERKSTIKKSSPDLIVIKNDSIAIIEIKGYPGMISFPININEVYSKEWTSKVKNFPEQIINEGSYNPYSQINNNRQALVAYLRKHEEKFSSDELKGSNWDKTESFILFSNDTVEFSYSTEKRREKGNWFHTFHLGALHETKNGEYFPHFIKDLTTGPRIYKKDDRTEIATSKSCVEKFCELLECIDVTEEFLGPEADIIEEEDIQSSAVGFAPTLVRTIRETSEERIEKSFKPSASVLKLSRELRILSYYQTCLAEESKHGMNIFLNSKNADEKRFLVSGIRESIFSKNEEMIIPDNQLYLLNTNLRQNTPSLSFGFSLIITDTKIGSNKFWVCEPLFSTRVNYKNGEYTIAYKNDITVNQSALRKLPPYSDLHESQLEEKIDEIFQRDSTPIKVIETIFDELGLLNHRKLDDLMVLGNLDLSNLHRGFKPSCGLIFLSEGGIYSNLLKELRMIGKTWNNALNQDNEIDDLAYKFLKGVEFSDNDEWFIPLYNVGYSNYEQSQAIGSAINEKIPLTVVSGPPGTGKSQLGMNLISEINRQDKKIIFSSKNHKAVDVITDRYNSLFTSKEAIKRIARPHGNGTSGESKFSHIKLKADQRTIANSKILTNNHKLNSIKEKIQEYENALISIEDVNIELQQILQENPELQLIDWHIDDPKKLKLKYWEKKLTQFKTKQRRAKSFLSRALDSLTDDKMSFLDMFSQESFIEKNKRQIFDDLSKSLPKDIVEKIGKNNLFSFSKQYLSLLREVEVTSVNYKKYNKIISENDLMDLLGQWNNQCGENIDNSINLLDDKLESTSGKSPILNTAVTTLSASKLDKLEQGVYDLAVLDESSQTDIISALPILYRAKRAVIIGDEKQLFPIVSIDEEKDYNTFRAYQLKESDYFVYGYSHSSLLSVANNQIQGKNRRRTMLKEHFRCHPNIIEFSNRYFYNNDLRVKTDKNGTVGIRWEDHQSDCQPRWYNESESAIALKLIDEILLSKKYKPSQIGVVTPFRQQAKFIRNAISQKFGNQIGEKIIADTSHRFQGDEKKLMVFSLVIGPSMPKSTVKWIQEGKSKNLINVAITRAKEELIIIGNRSEIDKRGGLLSDLGDWVEYCIEGEKKFPVKGSEYKN